MFLLRIQAGCRAVCESRIGTGVGKCTCVSCWEFEEFQTEVTSFPRVKQHARLTCPGDLLNFSTINLCYQSISEIGRLFVF